jgi:hypothetical protein
MPAGVGGTLNFTFCEAENFICAVSANFINEQSE